MTQAAAVVDRPQPRVGDRWQFATRVVGGGAPLLLDHRLRERLPDGGFVIQVRRAGNAGPWLLQRFDAEFNRVARELLPGESVHYEPAFPLFRFPLHAGKRWALTVQQRQDGQPGQRTIEVEAGVVGAETVEVPAGRFETFRIEAVHRAGPVRIDTVYWYAAGARRSVRGVEISRSAQGDSELVYELQSFRLG